MLFIKVNRHTFRGDNYVKALFVSLLKKGSALKGKNSPFQKGFSHTGKQTGSHKSWDNFCDFLFAFRYAKNRFVACRLAANLLSVPSPHNYFLIKRKKMCLQHGNVFLFKYYIYI